LAAEGVLEVPDRHVARARLQRVQPDDAHRLRAELADRPRALVALEEADRDQGRDQAGQDDPEQEERRKPEAQRPEHGSRVLRYAGVVSRAGLTLYPTPQTVTMGDASPSLRRSWRTGTSTVRVSPA